MAKQTVNLALAVTAIVFSIGTLLFTLGGSSGTGSDSELGFDLRQLEERLALLETQLEKAENRRTQARPFRRPATSEEKTETAGLDQDENAPGEPQETPENNDEGLAVRISGLQTRIEALESDPIQRGFRYLDSDSAKLRAEGVKALEELARSDPQALAAIQDMMNDPSEDVRWWSIDSLADIDSKESIPLLMNMLDDSSAKVRREVINSLGRLGASDAGPQIAGFLDSEDPETRAYAADAIGKVKFAGASEALVASLEDKNGRVRSEAIWSLAEIGAKNAAPALRKIYNEDPGDNRYTLVRSLKMLGDNEPFNAEFKRLSAQAIESEDQNKRTEAIRNLTYFAKSEAKGIFEQLQKDPNKRVRDYAGWALRNDRRRR